MCICPNVVTSKMKIAAIAGSSSSSQIHTNHNITVQLVCLDTDGGVIAIFLKPCYSSWDIAFVSMYDLFQSPIPTFQFHVRLVRKHPSPLTLQKRSGNWGLIKNTYTQMWISQTYSGLYPNAPLGKSMLHTRHQPLNTVYLGSGIWLPQVFCTPPAKKNQCAQVIPSSPPIEPKLRPEADDNAGI